MPGIYAGILVGWGLMALLGGYVASQKGRSDWEGIGLGLLFGPLGVLVEALLPSGQDDDDQDDDDQDDD